MARVVGGGAAVELGGGRSVGPASRDHSCVVSGNGKVDRWRVSVLVAGGASLQTVLYGWFMPMSLGCESNVATGTELASTVGARMWLWRVAPVF